MTGQFNARSSVTDASVATIGLTWPDAVQRSWPRPGSALQRLSQAARRVAAGASAFGSQFRAGLHESRRMQAMIICARYQHLIFDPDTGMALPTPLIARGPGSPDREELSR
jgi:hypothetical protein